MATRNVHTQIPRRDPDTLVTRMQESGIAEIGPGDELVWREAAVSAASETSAEQSATSSNQPGPDTTAGLNLVQAQLGAPR